MSHATNYSELLDAAVRPQDDFFSYVNKKWLASHPIPPSETRWGTFNILRDEAWAAMRDIYESLQGGEYAPGSVEQQARDFYHAGLNFDKYQAAHFALLRQYFHEIDAIDSKASLSKFIGKMNALQIGAPWYVWVDTDHDDSTQHILHIYQSGLTLPNSDYYLQDTDAMKKIRAEYKKYVAKVVKELPELGEAKAVWQALMPFETSLAEVSRSPADLRDVEKNFNKTTFANLQKDYPQIDWPSYSMALGWKSPSALSVDQPEFLQFAATLIDSADLATWKIYLKWRIANRCLPRISDKLATIHFSFFGKTLSGTKEQMPLWKRVVLAADPAIGEATGKLYAQRHFPESSKQQVLQLVEDLRGVYGKRISELSWMSDKTKKYALKKLANMKVLIGYPDKWRDFSRLTITPDSYLGNTLEASRFDMAYWLGRLGTPTLRDDWFMNPQTVNAYHDPTRLVICFPAAILQAPFFDAEAPLAANMGGIGMVIGHEFTHGFDDQGCRFDATGNVRQWQTDGERAEFTRLAQGIVDQADAFKVLPDLTLRGKLVLGESIADLGGIEIAFAAFQAQMGDNIDQKVSGNLTNRQLFFINYAYTECSSIREEKQREYTLIDPHPASEFRVNGILQHVDAFYQAFDIQKPDKLYRPASARVKIW